MYKGTQELVRSEEWERRLGGLRVAKARAQAGGRLHGWGGAPASRLGGSRAAGAESSAGCSRPCRAGQRSACCASSKGAAGLQRVRLLLLMPRPRPVLYPWQVLLEYRQDEPFTSQMLQACDDLLEVGAAVCSC